MRIGFRFRTIPFAATVLLVALGLALAHWQDGRAQQKLALQAQMAARSAQAPLVLDGGAALAALQGAATPSAASLAASTASASLVAPAGWVPEFRRVRMSGEFVRGWPLYLDNRPYEGRAGLYVTMPFRLKGTTTHVLVARGWVARNAADRARLPDYPTPEGEVVVEGVVRAGIGHVMELGAAAPLKPGAIVQNLEPAQLTAASGLSLLPFVVEQSGPSAPGDALVRDWPAPALGVEKHVGYAFQWRALAAMAFLFFVITGFRRGTKTN